MSSVRVVTDSATDLADNVNSELGIEVVPLKIRIDDREYVDVFELSKEKFWSLSSKAQALPQTSAPSVGDFEKTFRDLISGGSSEIVCVTLSSELSATYQSATLAAKTFEGDARIAIVDSRTASLGEGLMAVSLAEDAARGESYEHLVVKAQSYPGRSRTFGTLDTLDSLRKGGRIGAAQALVGSLLSFKPVIEVSDGSVQAESRQRTRSRALAYLIEKVRSFGAISQVGVVHAQAPDVEDFVSTLQREAGIEEVMLATMGPVIGSHVGPRTIGVTFWVTPS